MDRVVVYRFFEFYPFNSLLSRIMWRIMRFIIRFRVMLKFREVVSIVSLPEVRKYSIDLVFPGLIGHDLSYVFAWKLVSSLVEKGYDVLEFRYNDLEYSTPLQVIRLVGYDKVIVITWYFEVNGHVSIEVDELENRYSSSGDQYGFVNGFYEG